MRRLLIFLIIPLTLSAQQFTTRHKMTVLQKQKMTHQLAGGSRVVLDSVKQNLPVFIHANQLKITALPPGIQKQIELKFPAPQFESATLPVPAKTLLANGCSPNVAQNDSLDTNKIFFWKVTVKCGPVPEKRADN